MFGLNNEFGAGEMNGFKEKEKWLWNCLDKRKYCKKWKESLLKFVSKLIDEIIKILFC